MLKQIEFDVKTCSYDSVIIRLDVNRMQDDSLSPGETYFQNPVYVTVSKSNKGRTYKADVENVFLGAGENIYLSLECVQFFGEGDIRFSIRTQTGYLKEHPMARLEKLEIPVHIAISLWAWYIQ
jgi:hypothetical protein